MAQENKKILSITQTKGYWYCNVCNKRVFEDGTGLLTRDDTRTHELQFGRNNYSTSIRLCTECLNKFADNLWEYLEKL